jgi:hypothetical protein
LPMYVPRYTTVGRDTDRCPKYDFQPDCEFYNHQT